MTRISVKSAPRKTQVSRAKVRSILIQLRDNTSNLATKGVKRGIKKVGSSKTISRKSILRKAS